MSGQEGLSQERELMFVFDLDDTIVTGNTYDYLCANRSEEVRAEIEAITRNVTSANLSDNDLIRAFTDAVNRRIGLLKLTEEDFSLLKAKYSNNLSEGARELIDYLRDDLSAVIFLVSFALKRAVNVAGDILNIPRAQALGLGYEDSDEGVQLGNDGITQSLLALSKPNALVQSLVDLEIIDEIHAKIIHLVLVGDSPKDLEAETIIERVAAINKKVSIVVTKIGILSGSKAKEAKLCAVADYTFRNMRELHLHLQSIIKALGL